MSRSVTQMTIDDAEHMSPEKREQIIASYPEHELEARTKGIPVLGSGRIYPVTEESITCEAFAIPKHWALLGGLDFGWTHPTAGAAIAIDRDADCIYLISVYKRSKATPLEHAATLKGWQEDMPWAWPHDGEQTGKDGAATLAVQYKDTGMNLMATHATHAEGGYGVEAGIMEILTRMQTGRFKVFAHLNDFWKEFRLYHRKNGVIVKTNDDLLDAVRIAVMARRFAIEAGFLSGLEEEHDGHDGNRSSTTGY